MRAERPDTATEQLSPELAETTNRCASCHRRETPAIVEEYERSAHVEKRANCLDCHQPQEDPESFDHKGVTLAKSLTSKNCGQCHAEPSRQCLRAATGVLGFALHVAPLFAEGALEPGLWDALRFGAPSSPSFSSWTWPCWPRSGSGTSTPSSPPRPDVSLGRRTPVAFAPKVPALSGGLTALSSFPSE
ncbi:MAG: hypothetical protein BRD55_07210 [Bacteroidetes bacterium SW_9_63_38]|nr:MAG: hypothetical protein BRD55_07210 [Bacteroidetes bacterium SW_9_63_38]